MTEPSEDVIGQLPSYERQSASSVRVSDDARAAASVYGTGEYGRACASADSGQWIILHDERERWQLPLVVRRIPGTDRLDAATPYGYGGLHVSPDVTDDEARSLWASTRDVLKKLGIVSVFVRFPPFLPAQAQRAATLDGFEVAPISRTVLVPTATPDEMWSGLHKRSRSAVRAAERNGCTGSVVDASDASVSEARALYDQTMKRIGADSRYFFDEVYYDELRQLGTRLAIARVVDASGHMVAASFIMRDGDFAHYHLSGSTGTASGSNNLMIWTVMKWAANEGMIGVHLGGGLTSGDSLHHFKKSFGGKELDFHVGRVIIDEKAYYQLTALKAKEAGSTDSGAFFPAYRAYA